MAIKVKKQGKNSWGVYFDGRLIEGGFFSREGAEVCAASYKQEQRNADRVDDLDDYLGASPDY